MLNRIYEYFITQPSRLKDLGYTLFMAASAAIFAGAVARIFRVAANPFGGVVADNAHSSLLKVLPASFPTWWIPETFEGFVFYAILTLTGVLAVRAGKKLEKLLNRH